MCRSIACSMKFVPLLSGNPWLISAVLIPRCWPQANLLFEAQLKEGATCSLLATAMGSLPASLAADGCRNVGAILLEKIEDRMQHNGSGAAKTVKAAWEQAHAVLLLQAMGHPAAAKYGLTDPSQPSTVSPPLRSESCSTPTYLHRSASCCQVLLGLYNLVLGACTHSHCTLFMYSPGVRANRMGAVDAVTRQKLRYFETSMHFQVE